jgi:hypothetical protein
VGPVVLRDDLKRTLLPVSSIWPSIFLKASAARACGGWSQGKRAVSNAVLIANDS